MAVTAFPFLNCFLVLCPSAVDDFQTLSVSKDQGIAIISVHPNHSVNSLQSELAILWSLSVGFHQESERKAIEKSPELESLPLPCRLGFTRQEGRLNDLCFSYLLLHNKPCQGLVA